MSIESILLSIFLVFILGYLVFSIVTESRNSKKEDEVIFDETYFDLISILDTLIKREFSFKYKLEYELKGQDILHDFEKEYRDLSKDILGALSLDFINNFKRYHSQDYLLFYITKNVQLMLIEYINTKK